MWKANLLVKWKLKFLYYLYSISPCPVRYAAKFMRTIHSHWHAKSCSLTILCIMDSYYVIKIFTPTTSTVKVHWGFHVYKTHLLDHHFLAYNHTPPLACKSCGVHFLMDTIYLQACLEENSFNLLREDWKDHLCILLVT